MISDKNTINEHLSKAEILSRLFSIWNPSVRTETVPLQEAYGRVLAEDQRAQFDLPVVRASSMDGIAVRSADFLDGMPDTSGWKAGREFVRADTGDDFDDAYDSVIRIEDVRIGDDGSLTLCLPEGTVPEPGMNVRPAGSMLKKGVLLAESGHTITAMDLAALESGGITSVPVVKKPVVGFIPTGSELTAPGNIPQRGQNIDCNSTLAKISSNGHWPNAISYSSTAALPRARKTSTQKSFSAAERRSVTGSRLHPEGPWVWPSPTANL